MQRYRSPVQGALQWLSGRRPEQSSGLRLRRYRAAAAATAAVKRVD